MKDPEIDAAVIATPTASHFDLAMQALQAGKHVLAEKP
jgi:predicted dehydrogenase